MEVLKLCVWLFLLWAPLYSTYFWQLLSLSLIKIIQIFYEYTKDFNFLFTLGHILPDHFHLGPDAGTILWKMTLVAASLGIYVFAIFLWRTVLWVKPPMYQVSLQHITEKTKSFMNDNAELKGQLSTWKQEDTINRFERKNNDLNSMLQNARVLLESQRALNIKHQELLEKNAETVTLELSDLRSRKRHLQEMRRTLLEESCKKLRFLQKNKEEELSELKNKNSFLLTFYQQRNAKIKEKPKKENTTDPLIHIQRKLKRKQHKRVKIENRLYTSKNMLESLEDEIKKYKQQAKKIWEELSNAEFTFQQQECPLKLDPEQCKALSEKLRQVRINI